MYLTSKHTITRKKKKHFNFIDHMSHTIQNTVKEVISEGKFVVAGTKHSFDAFLHLVVDLTGITSHLDSIGNNGNNNGGGSSDGSHQDLMKEGRLLGAGLSFYRRTPPCF